MPLLETHSFLVLVARWHANRADEAPTPDLQTFHRRAATTLLDALYPDESRVHQYPDPVEAQQVAHWAPEAEEADRELLDRLDRVTATPKKKPRRRAR